MVQGGAPPPHDCGGGWELSKDVPVWRKSTLATKADTLAGFIPALLVAVLLHHCGPQRWPGHLQPLHSPTAQLLGVWRHMQGQLLQQPACLACPQAGC